MIRTLIVARKSNEQPLLYITTFIRSCLRSRHARRQTQRQREGVGSGETKHETPQKSRTSWGAQLGCRVARLAGQDLRVALVATAAAAAAAAAIVEFAAAHKQIFVQQATFHWQCCQHFGQLGVPVLASTRTRTRSWTTTWTRTRTWTLGSLSDSVYGRVDSLNRCALVYFDVLQPLL